MADGKVKWDIDLMQTSAQALSTEQTSLQTQRSQMIQQKSRVDVNWKSPAGQQYQNRLETDIAAVDHILRQLTELLTAFQKTINCYGECENQVMAALRRLP